MQKLKRKPLLPHLANTLQSLIGFVGRLRKTLLPSPRWLTMVALIVLLILALSVLSGCSRPVVRPTLPPQADPRPMPEWRGTTNRDVFGYIPRLREWGLSCEADKAVLRKVYGDE